jgi:hypothetical protein
MADDDDAFILIRNNRIHVLVNGAETIPLSFPGAS